MRRNVIEIHSNGNVLLLGRFMAFSKVRPELREPRKASALLHQMWRQGNVIHQFRHAWGNFSSHPVAAHISDAELLQLIDHDILSHRIQGIPLHSVRLTAISGKAGASDPQSIERLLKAAGIETGPQAKTSSFAMPMAHAYVPPSLMLHGRQQQGEAIQDWGMARRVTEIGHRAAALLPDGEKQLLLSLVSPENIGIMVGSIIAVILAQGTPAAIFVDAGLTAMAFYFGGLAALEAIDGLLIFLDKVYSARSEDDLKAGAEALKNVVIAVQIVGLMVLLHKLGNRKGTGGRAEKAGEPPPIKSESSPARPVPAKPLPPPSPEKPIPRPAAEKPLTPPPPRNPPPPPPPQKPVPPPVPMNPPPPEESPAPPPKPVPPPPETTRISPEMEEKILYGERCTNSSGNPTNRVRGGHSGEITNDHPDYAVETRSENPDGTKDVKFVKSFGDGTISNPKSSTLFPESWDRTKIMDATKQVGDTPAVATRADGATLHQGTVDGVKMEVIKVGPDVTASYPNGSQSPMTPSDFSGN